MDRRGFLARLPALGLVVKAAPALLEAAAQPFKGLTFHGAEIIPDTGTELVSLDAINAATVKHILPVVTDNFFKTSPLMDYGKDRRAHKHDARALPAHYLPAEKLVCPGCGEIECECIGGEPGYWEDEA